MGMGNLRMPPGGWVPTTPRNTVTSLYPRQGPQLGWGTAGARPGRCDAPRLHPCPLAPGHVPPQPSLSTSKGPARPGAGLLAPLSPGPREGLAQQGLRKSLLMGSNLALPALQQRVHICPPARGSPGCHLPRATYPP